MADVAVARDRVAGAYREAPARGCPAADGPRATAVELVWLPLGAGGHCVRLNGLVYEAVAAAIARRPRCSLYHSALEVTLPAGRFVIEMAPVRDGDGRRRGVVAEGAVGSPIAGRLRLFRYEIRRWRGGRIPDIDEAVESPRPLTADPDVRASAACAGAARADSGLGP